MLTEKQYHLLHYIHVHPETDPFTHQFPLQIIRDVDLVLFGELSALGCVPQLFANKTFYITDTGLALISEYEADQERFRKELSLLQPYSGPLSELYWSVLRSCDSPAGIPSDALDQSVSSELVRMRLVDRISCPVLESPFPQTRFVISEAGRERLRLSDEQSRQQQQRDDQQKRISRRESGRSWLQFLLSYLADHVPTLFAVLQKLLK